MERTIATNLQKIIDHGVKAGVDPVFFNAIHKKILSEALTGGGIELGEIAKSPAGQEILYLISCSVTGRRPT